MRWQRCAAGVRKTQAEGRATRYGENICLPVVAPLSEPEPSFIDGRLMGFPAADAAGLPTATWRSGYAAVCKTVYPGSIPGVASSLHCRAASAWRTLLARRAFPCRTSGTRVGEADSVRERHAP